MRNKTNAVEAGVVRLVVGLLVAGAACAACAAEGVLPVAFTRLLSVTAPVNAYVNTGFSPNQNSRVVMDVAVSSMDEYWFGAWNKAYNNGAFCLGNDAQASSNQVYAGYDGQGGGSFALVPVGRHTVELDKNVAKVDGEAKKTFTESAFQLSYPLYLCGQNRQGTFKAMNNQKVVCYGCQVYDDGTCVRDFVPCRRNEDGVAGFYDLAGETFYASANTGVAFVAGPVGQRTGTTLTVESEGAATPITAADLAGVETLVMKGNGTLILDDVPFAGTLAVSNGTVAAFSPFAAVNVGAVVLDDGARFAVGDATGYAQMSVAGTARIQGAVKVNVHPACRPGTYTLISASALQVEQGASITLAEDSLTGFGQAPRTLQVTETGVTLEVGAPVQLPAGYTAAAYLQSSGQQWISAEVVCNAQTVVEADFGNISYGHCCAFFGEDSWAGGRYLFNMQSGKFYFHDTGIIFQNVESNCDYYMKHGRSLTSVAKADGTSTMTLASPNAISSADRNLALFGINTGTYRASYRLYGLRVWSETGALLRAFTPCVNPQGEAGLYDWVERRFFRNRGTGRFLTAPIPETRLDYAQSYGAQGVRLDYAMTADTTVKMDFGQVTYANSTAFFGLKWTGDSYLFNQQSDRFHFHGSGTTKIDAAGKPEAGVNYSVEVTDNNEIVIQKEGADAPTTMAVTRSIANSTADPYLAIFNDNALGHGASFRFYDMVIAKVGVEQRRLIPWRNADGLVGLKDELSGTFYPNGQRDALGYGLAYRREGETLTVYDGTLTDAALAETTNVIKEGEGVLSLAVNGLSPTFTVNAGTLSLKDGVADSMVTIGSLTLAGGVHLALEASPNATDALRVDELDLSRVSSANPVYLDFSAPAVMALGANETRTILSGVTLTAADANKFKLTGIPARLTVVDGALVLAAAVPVDAEWTGAESEEWSLAGNWLNSLLPTSGSTVKFNLPTGGEMVDDLVGVQPGVVTFGEDAGAFTFHGAETLTILSSITNLSAAAQHFLLPTAFGVQGYPFTVRAEGDLTFDQTTTSTYGTFTKTGAGTLTVSDQALYAPRAITIEEGTLKIGERTGTDSSRYYSGVIGTSDTLLWRDTQLADVIGFTARNTGASFPGDFPMVPFFYANDGQTASCQFQLFDTQYAKCVCVTFTQKGPHVYARTTKACYIEQKAGLGHNCNNPMTINKKSVNFTNMTIATSPTASGYNVFHVYPILKSSGMVFSESVIGTGTPGTLVWKNVKLKDVISASATGTGGSAMNGSPGCHFWTNNGQTATCQFQGYDNTYTKHVAVTFTQVGNDVYARGTFASYDNGNTVGNDMTKSYYRQSTVATTTTMRDYGLMKLRPVFKMPPDFAATLTVKDGARLDVNLNHGSTASLAKTESTHGRVVYVEGDGPDGKGALYNSITNNTWGCTFGKIVLTGDASAGGGSLDLRQLGASAVGEETREVMMTGPWTFTIHNLYRFDFVGATFGLHRLAADGTVVFENTIGGTITNGVHLLDGATLRFYQATVGEGLPFFVEEDARLTVQSESSTCTVKGPFTVGAGAAVAVNATKPLAFTNVLRVDGVVSNTAAEMVTVSTALTGTGAVDGKFAFSGTNTCWRLKADANGFTERVDLAGAVAANPNALAQLARIEVTFSTLPEVAQRWPLCPAGNLTMVQAEAIEVVARDANDEEVPGVKATVIDGVVTLCVLDDSMPTAAYWTGEGDPNNTLDPANWFCQNSFAEDLPGAVPMGRTVIYLENGCTFNCPPEAGLIFKKIVLAPNMALGGACDWRGVPFSAFVTADDAQGVTIVDLAGHDLRLLVDMTPTQEIIFTDTSAEGEGGALHIEVPSGKSVQNNTLSLFGSLAFVKDGAGTFDARKGDQSYTGGTEVTGGTLTQIAGSSAADTTYTPGLYHAFGPTGSSITVRSGATFDIRGLRDYYLYSMTLDGGTLYNAVAQDRPDDAAWQSIGNLTLTADANLTTTTKTMVRGGPLTLNGHRLSISIAIGSYLYMAGGKTIHGPGKIDVTSGGWFDTYSGTVEARDVDFRINAALIIWGTLNVHDLEMVYSNGDYGEGSGSINIFGTFAPPNHTYMRGFVMQNGSTLDLSTKTNVWSTTTTLAKCTELKFAPGARVNVDITGRSLKPGDQVISWATEPTGVTFNSVVKEGPHLVGLTVRKDGVYCISRSTVIFFR